MVKETKECSGCNAASGAPIAVETARKLVAIAAIRITVPKVGSCLLKMPCEDFAQVLSRGRASWINQFKNRPAAAHIETNKDSSPPQSLVVPRKIIALGKMQ